MKIKILLPLSIFILVGCSTDINNKLETQTKSPNIVYSSTILNNTNKNTGGRLINSTLNGLIAMDAQYNLRLYPFVNGTFIGNGGGALVGNGFNFTDYFAADWYGNGSTSLIVRDANGFLKFYLFLNNTFYRNGGGKEVGNSFNFSNYFIGEINGNGTPDLTVRDNSGSLYRYPWSKTQSFYDGNGGGVVSSQTTFNYTDYLMADWNQDGYMDVLGRESNGSLKFSGYLYLGTFDDGSHGIYNAGIQVGSGFNFSNYFIGHTNNSILGKATTLICRNPSGDLFEYLFYNGSFFNISGQGRKIGSNFNYTDYFVGDWTGDGYDDFICRDSSGGLYFFPYVPSTNSLAPVGVNVGNGFNFAKYFPGAWYNPSVPIITF